MDAVFKMALDAGGLGVAIVALYIFYKMIVLNSNERKESSKEWRETFKKSSEDTEKVLKELITTIKDTKK